MSFTRRDFVISSAATLAAAVPATAAALPRRGFGIGRPDADPIRIGVIGVGGRGTGAARDAIAASENVSVVALGDVFPDKMSKAREQFARIAGEKADFAAKYQVTDDRVFVGLDAIDKVLIPGIVSHQTNVVEHPELVSWRIQNYASVVGRDRVIAGTDCGFSQGWMMQRVHEEVQWAKLGCLQGGGSP